MPYLSVSLDGMNVLEKFSLFIYLEEMLHRNSLDELPNLIF